MTGFKHYSGTAFRYRSFNNSGINEDESRKRIEQMIVDGKFWFSSARELNDVHELNPQVIRNHAMMRRHWAAGLKKLEKEGYKFRPKALSNMMQKQRLLMEENSVQSILDFGICSLSKLGTLHTQWAYYGDNHRGFAVEFSIDDGDPCYEVIYSDVRPKLHYPEDLTDGVWDTVAMRIMLTKSREWEKEQEVRLIAQQRGLVSLKHSVRSVIFGVSTDLKDKEYMATLINKNNLQIKLCECKLVEDRFDLKIVPWE